MANKLDIPDELAHLIEKREQGERRAASAADPGVCAPSAQPSGDDAPAPEDDRRVTPDRRQA